MRASARLFFFGLAPVMFLVLSSAAGQDEKPPKVADTKLSPEQIAIYRAVLDDWAAGDRAVIYLSMFTNPASAGDETRDCFKKPDFEQAIPNLAHRVHEEDLASLGSHTFRLVDPREHAKLIEANDPENLIREGKGGKDLDKAVDNAVAHGLFTLGEIRFDATHTYALVFYGFRCGMLCGHGSTLLMKKTGESWRRIKTCGGWVS